MRRRARESQRAAPRAKALTAASVVGAWLVVAAAVGYLGCTSWADSGDDLGIRVPDSVTGRMFGVGIAVVGIAVRLLSLSVRL